MQRSSSRFKALVVSTGLSFWFFIIISALGVFSLEIFLLFVSGIVILTQVFAIKLSKTLDKFAIINTKIFLSILFIFVISIYGIIFRLLKIDLLRYKTQKQTYWLNANDFKKTKISKQY